MDKNKVKSLVEREFENVVNVSEHGTYNKCWHVYILYEGNKRQFILQRTIKGWVSNKVESFGRLDVVLLALKLYIKETND